MPLPRPLRGGSFFSNVFYCAGNDRDSALFDYGLAYNGFRLSRMSSK